MLTCSTVVWCLAADEARKRVKAIPVEELEGQYIDLVSPHTFETVLREQKRSYRVPSNFILQFQEMKRQERTHLKERSRMNREKVRLEFRSF